MVLASQLIQVRDICSIVYNALIGVKIETRNILFVGAGAFEKSKPWDLAVELQGRLPVQVKMSTLSVDDFKEILTNTKHSLLTQAVELLRVDSLNVAFSEGAINEMSQIAYDLNQEDDIGARRLRTVLD